MKGQSLVVMKRFWSTAVLFSFVSASLAVGDVFVSSYNGTNTADVVPCPLSCVAGGNSWSTVYSTATPAPPATVRRCRYGTTTNAVWSITPTDTELSVVGGAPHYYNSLQAPSVYKILITVPTASAASSDLVVNMTCTGGSLGPTAVVPVTAFRSSSPRDLWINVGYITNDIPNPTITFTYASGAISNTARWYMDAVRFETLSCGCCFSPVNVGVAGPLFAGQSNVLVTNVSVGATNITVYANGNSIGATNYAPGFAGGQVMVSTATLTAGSVIRATQTQAGCTSVFFGAGSTVQSFVALNLNPEKQAGISINGVVGYTYQIQSLNDLKSTNWVSRTNITLQQPNEIWVDTSTSSVTNPSSFYRVLLVP